MVHPLFEVDLQQSHILWKQSQFGLTHKWLFGCIRLRRYMYMFSERGATHIIHDLFRRSGARHADLRVNLCAKKEDELLWLSRISFNLFPYKKLTLYMIFWMKYGVFFLVDIVRLCKVEGDLKLGD